MDAAEKTYVRLLPHVSRCCFARVTKGDGLDLVGTGTFRYRCTNCDAEAVGRECTVLCACGIRLKAGTGPNAGIRCVPNLNPTPECPSRFVAEQK